jgi:hypothetical protein
MIFSEILLIEIICLFIYFYYLFTFLFIIRFIIGGKMDDASLWVLQKAADLPQEHLELPKQVHPPRLLKSSEQH